MIGAVNNSDQPFVGQVDELIMYKRAISPGHMKLLGNPDNSYFYKYGTGAWSFTQYSLYETLPTPTYTCFT
jgi:hypothetical protein